MSRDRWIALTVAAGLLSLPAAASTSSAAPTTAAKPTVSPVTVSSKPSETAASKPGETVSSKPSEAPTTKSKTTSTAKKTASSASSDSMTLKADRDGTVFKSLTVEGEDRIRIEFERPPIELELNPEKAPGLEWGSARDVLDRSIPDFGAPFVAQSARESSPFVARPWLGEFTGDAVARFRPQVDGVERWKLTVANARGEAITTFQGRGNPPDEIVWDGRTSQGEPATPGLRYSYVFEAFDRAGNKRNFVGEGFQLTAYRLSTPSGPVLVCAGSLLTPPPTTVGMSASVPAPALSEVATWVNQGGEPNRPIRVAITARNADAGNAIAATIMRHLPSLVPGDPSRIQCAVQVQPDAPESGAVRFSAPSR
jgi:hypothetical protein